MLHEISCLSSCIICRHSERIIIVYIDGWVSCVEHNWPSVSGVFFFVVVFFIYLPLRVLRLAFSVFEETICYAALWFFGDVFCLRRY